MRKLPLLVLITVLFSGCLADRHLFTTGPILSHKPTSGLAHALAMDGKEKMNASSTRSPDVVDRTTAALDHSSGPLPVPGDAGSQAAPERRVGSSTTLNRAQHTLRGSTVFTSGSTQAEDQEEEDENLMPRKKWNFLAVPAFVFALGTIALGLFTTSTTAVLVAAVLTIVLAGLSIRRIRSREQAGKGFALLALILAILALLATAIAIAVVGFV